MTKEERAFLHLQVHQSLTEELSAPSTIGKVESCNLRAFPLSFPFVRAQCQMKQLSDARKLLRDLIGTGGSFFQGLDQGESWWGPPEYIAHCHSLLSSVCGNLWERSLLATEYLWTLPF